MTFGQRLNHWWFFLLRGVLFILIGIYMLTSPAISFVAIGFLFGLFILIAGISELISSTSERTQVGRGFLLLLGITEVILGLPLMAYNTGSMTILRVILGLWVLYRGSCLISLAPHNRRQWLRMAAAIPVLIFGVLVLFNTTLGNLTIIFGSGMALVINGLSNTMVGIRMKQRWFIRSQKSPQPVMETFVNI